MEHFLSKTDYNFFTTNRSCSKKYRIVTNKGYFEIEPIDKKTITHLRPINLIRYNPENLKIDEYINLEYLHYINNSKNINFSNFVNLQTLIIHFTNIENKNLENLPCIKTLIFRNITLSHLRRTNCFMLNNLPPTIEKIVFSSLEYVPETYKEKKYIEEDDIIISKLKEKISILKIPFDCKIYYIDLAKNLHMITN